MQLTSSSFRDGQPIPTRYTGDGDDVAPELSWSDVPGDAQSLALCCIDPDAPSGTFTHWTLWNLDPTADRLPEGQVPTAPARQGTNDFGNVGYGGPAPPAGHGIHHYHFQLWALRQPLDLEDGASPEEFSTALHDVEIDHAELIGLYERA